MTSLGDIALNKAKCLLDAVETPLSLLHCCTLYLESYECSNAIRITSIFVRKTIPRVKTIPILRREEELDSLVSRMIKLKKTQVLNSDVHNLLTGKEKKL